MLISRALLHGHGGKRLSNSRSFIHHRWSKTAGWFSGEKVPKHAHQSRVNDVCCIEKKEKNLVYFSVQALLASVWRALQALRAPVDLLGRATLPNASFPLFEDSLGRTGVRLQGHRNNRRPGCTDPRPPPHAVPRLSGVDCFCLVWIVLEESLYAMLF